MSEAGAATTAAGGGGGGDITVSAGSPGSSSTQAATPSGGKAAAETVSKGSVQSAPAVQWTESLSPEMKDYVTTKGFKDPSMLLDSYVNLEKLRGVPQERLLKLPESADASEWNDVYSKLGRPDNPDGYGLQVPEKGDPAFVNWAKDAFHKLNLTKNQATGLLEKFSEYVGSKNTESLEQYKSKVAEQEINLKKDWGSAYHQNIAVAQQAAKTFGIPSEAVDAMEKAIGFDGVMKLMSNIGMRLGESKYVSGQSNSQNAYGETMVLTPQQARARIENLRRDPDFVSKYTAGHPDAVNKMNALHQMAYSAD